MTRNYANYHGVVKRRPLFDENTPLGQVPLEWLQHVEPKVVRKGFKGCWIAYGHSNGEGKPMMMVKGIEGKRKKKTLARYVMSIFYDFPEGYIVRRTCAFQQCVNPNHLYLSPHWRQA